MSISIFDNFLSKDEFDILTNEISKPNYQWEHVSNSYSEFDHPCLKMSLTDIPFFNTIIKSKIENTVNMTFDVKRIYTHGLPYGTVSGFHTDSTDTNEYTFLLFVHDCYKTNVDIMGGYFYYKLNDEIRCIEPIKNRAILFDSNIVHKDNAFNMGIKVLRQSIAWKLYHTNNNINNRTMHKYHSATVENLNDNVSILDISKIFETSTSPDKVEHFEPFLSLLCMPSIINCDKAIAIAFNNATKHEKSISYILTNM